MKFAIKTAIALAMISLILGFLLRYADRNEYEILKPEVINTEDDRSSWAIIMDVKKDIFKNIEMNWQKKHTK
ncbi:MAG TPA: hypothetical protein PK079_15870 [Leptospiraceae bacterium]|nr:hypothetical protein [Leptospiraceae bacterium]HMW07666.1 hypothetical protein [Leptospiraceae bacterium]HMX33800.1 hypothetical protein [Leptospiraceae bacterium]HMY33320.1 hypothetical protein [Leptospiraceae bacterium]HMZ63057.1 hypothetical protein [Leptospiraceae bacterium]